MKLDDGWPESAEEQVTLVLLEVVHKKTVVNVLILIQLMNRKEMRVINRKEIIEKGDNRDDMLDSRQI